MDITLNLPEDLINRARAAGLLTDERIAELIQAELDRQRSKAEFFTDVQRLRAQTPPLTPEEIETELKQLREARAMKRKVE